MLLKSEQFFGIGVDVVARTNWPYGRETAITPPNQPNRLQLREFLTPILTAVLPYAREISFGRAHVN